MVWAVDSRLRGNDGKEGDVISTEVEKSIRSLGKLGMT